MSETCFSKHTFSWPCLLLEMAQEGLEVCFLDFQFSTLGVLNFGMILNFTLDCFGGLLARPP